jgi:hypothetical protein
LFAFDLIEHDSADLRDLPLIERKRRLARLIGKSMRRSIRFVEHLTDDGSTVFDHVCRMGLEDIVSKRMRPIAVGRPRCGSSRRTQPARRCDGSTKRTGTADQAYSSNKSRLTLRCFTSSSLYASAS